MTNILALRPDGKIEEVAWYTLEPKAALIAFYMQHEKRNHNTWEYPQDIPGVIKEYPKHPGAWYFDAPDGTVYSTNQA